MKAYSTDLRERIALAYERAKTYAASSARPFRRWFINRMKSIRGEQMLSIMRALDKVMNNTSAILLFEVGDKKLLFPGDAQIENWSYALGKPSVRKLLADVNLYKVGHHASLIATPFLSRLISTFSQRAEKNDTHPSFARVCYFLCYPGVPRWVILWRDVS